MKKHEEPLVTAVSLTIDMVHEYFPGAFANPVTVTEEVQLMCYRAVGCLSTEESLRQEAREHLAAVINELRKRAP